MPKKKSQTNDARPTERLAILILILTQITATTNNGAPFHSHNTHEYNPWHKERPVASMKLTCWTWITFRLAGHLGIEAFFAIFTTQFDPSNFEPFPSAHRPNTPLHHSQIGRWYHDAHSRHRRLSSQVLIRAGTTLLRITGGKTSRDSEIEPTEQATTSW